MKVVFEKEDISAEVKVLEDERGDLALYINEKQQGGTRVAQTERWSGQMPLVFHSKPDSVLLIGLGTGATLKALTEGPVQHITCVDLIGSLTEAADKFKAINGAVLRNDKRVSFVEADGINYLNLSQNKFDLILCDIVHPDDAGAGDLYSREFYQICKNGLTADGLFVQWILLDQLAPSDLKIILATFYHVFPGLQLFLGQEQTIHQKLMLIGGKGELKWNIDEIRANLQKLTFSSEFPGKDDPYSFLSYFVGSGTLLENQLASAKMNTRNHPVIEYQSPRHRWLTGKSITNLDLLRTFRQPVNKGTDLIAAADSLVEKYFNTRTQLLQGRLLEYHGQYEKADTAYSLAALHDVDTLLVSYLLEQNAGNLAAHKKNELAVTAYKKSLAVNHLNTSASFSLAEWLLQHKQEAEAIEFFRYTAYYDPDDYQAMRRLGDIYSVKKDFDQAFYYYTLSLTRNDHQPLLHYILGQIYANHKNDPVNALKSLKRSLELNPYHHYNKQAREAVSRLEKGE
jgi:spermidine synthase